MPNYHQPLKPGESYHLFSRAIGSDKLFKSEENYRYFLSRCIEHTNGVADLYTYALLPNHFHLLARLKPVESIIGVYEEKKQKTYDPICTDLSDFIMERFSNWLNGYTKAFNKMYKRKGALFLDYMKRSHVGNDTDFSNFLFYIHKNSVHHGYTKKIGDWPWDGYRELLNLAPTNLLRKEVIEFLGGREAFVKFHNREIILKPVGWEDL